MQRVRAFHSDQFVLPLPPGHPFPMTKYRLLREAAEATLPGVRVTEAPPASDGELALAHEPDWIHAVTTGSTSAAQQREIGFPWSERMVERARRMRDLDGTPRLQLGTTDEFFAHLETEVAAGAPVPVWNGELYFETHRGTLTSQIETKVGNRRCERLLREAELWWAAGGRVSDEVTAQSWRSPRRSPGSTWDGWRSTQGHATGPGSSSAPTSRPVTDPPRCSRPARPPSC